MSDPLLKLFPADATLMPCDAIWQIEIWGPGNLPTFKFRRNFQNFHDHYNMHSFKGGEDERHLIDVYQMPTLITAHLHHARLHTTNA